MLYEKVAWQAKLSVIKLGQGGHGGEAGTRGLKWGQAQVNWGIDSGIKLVQVGKSNLFNNNIVDVDIDSRVGVITPPVSTFMMKSVESWVWWHLAAGGITFQ